MKALAIAATGMNAQQTNLEVIANNIANINTTGYKRARAEFSDLLYQVDRTQGVPNRSNASLVPEVSAADRDPNNPASWGKIGRNEDCPCGSGKKYKHCHGKYG